MARMEIDGFREIEAQLGKLLDRSTRQRIVEAGARKDAEEMQKDIRGAGHVRTGSMLKSTRPAQYHEDVNSGYMHVYPQDNDGKGAGNAMKAFVINYGRKGRTRKTKHGERFIRDNFKGDKFITERFPQTEKAVQDAMQRESDRILAEINK